MNHRIDILLVHGITSRLNEQSYYKTFVDGIRKQAKELPLCNDLHFHPINWNKLLYEKEEKIFRWMEGMNWQSLRRFGCDYICDILAYSPPEHIPKPGDFYYDVNAMLSDRYDYLSKEYPKSRKVIISHSMGTQISFTFSWQREIDYLITMGSPILYFSVKFNDFGRYPEATLHKMANFWNSSDPVSTIISRNPSLQQCMDIRVKSANPVNWIPRKAHSYYWSSSFVHRAIAQILQNIN